MHEFAGCVALVSGGSSGIGLALAHALSAQGARVAITGTNREKLHVATESFADRDRVLPIPFDVTDAPAWRRAVERVESSWGTIGFLALNAGVGMGGENTEAVALETWRWAFDVNVMGVVNGLNACLPRLRAAHRRSHILITASIAGVWRAPTCGPYIASKAAVVALAETLRQELSGSGVGLSVLLPGVVRTEISATSSRASPVPMAPALLEQMQKFVEGGVDPRAVAEFALQRIAAGAFYVFTHPQVDDEIARRHEEMAAAMRITLPA